MKQGGAFLALILAISGILRVAGPGVAPLRQGTVDSSKKNAPSKHDNTTQYEEDLRRTIQQFFSDASEASPVDGVLAAHWNVPQSADAIHLVIAILPDPLHTRLALTFDRGIEAIQQGAARKGYRFDRAIFPWDRTAMQTPEDPVKRREMLKDQREREQFPGLLIFRGLQGNRYKAPLFVLVVGETPTGGIRKVQFRKAFDIIQQIRYKDSPRPNRLLILGPTTSGALLSLHQELSALSLPQGTETYVYSGTVTDARSMNAFGGHPHRHFASFLENDEYTSEQFLQFACHNGYSPDQLAILSESETVYGLQRVPVPVVSADQDRSTGDVPKRERDRNSQGAKPPPNTFRGCGGNETAESITQLTFPREISYFRSAYQKQSESQSKPQVPVSTSANLTLDSEELGTDDDAALPYAGAQTPPTQESVMLGIVSQLEKRHTRFTLLYASDPLDQLFLAGYLRSKYPIGRVVITTPDLLLTSQENSLLRGVLGLSVYSLAVGLTDSLCPLRDAQDAHRDRLFVSVSSVGTFNATVALLNVDNPTPRAAPGDATSSRLENDLKEFSNYGTPVFMQPNGSDCYCEPRPLVWVTMLGRDGFWPVAGLTNEPMVAADHKLPLLTFDSHGRQSTLFIPPPYEPAELHYKVSAPAALQTRPDQNPAEKRPKKPASQTPGAWRLAYALSLFFMVLHIYLSTAGSILADSEARAQFTRTGEPRDVKVIALGALALATAFVTLMFTRSPFVYWDGPVFTIVLWFPFAVFLIATLWDLGWHRSDRWSAILFAVGIVAMCACQWLAWHGVGMRYASAYWSTRLLHLASGVSPVLPILLLAAAGYWWMWQSLRGVTLVDLRRPRLPEQRELNEVWHAISDAEADELRTTAHPLYIKRGIVLSIVALSAIVLVFLDWKHPVQTIEGQLYDWCYAAILSLMIVSLLSCLLKLLWTWSKCQQILAGLDRLPLREAFGRMKHLSWSSLWNPGGSSMRATYKVMSRGLEDLERLKTEFLSLPAAVPVTVRKGAAAVSSAATSALTERDTVRQIYANIVNPSQYSVVQLNVSGWRVHKIADWFLRIGNAQPSSSSKGLLLDVDKHFRLQFLQGGILLRRKIQEQFLLDQLLTAVAALQKSMADSAAAVMEDCLVPWWQTNKGPVVSTDDHLPKKKLDPLLATAEEYVALTYINFLVTVLLRMRTLVITAIGVFVFIVLSMNVYPFEPHPALQTLAVALAISMVAAIAFVYAQMHRDSILSLMTSNTPGELGWDFWLKLGSAIAIPVFSLLATQFPEINQFLFSWLEPALQATK